ncbi:MAG TPA: alpha-2-macroglobulin family protein, partial [Myxococcales bacterium]|nr:alpha-2-macroglobulin family protein [Myxococcales bacterium]
IDDTARTLTYDVPDSFNGSLRVMAVAVSPQAVGAASRKAIIRAPFVLSPSVPAFVAPGDEFQVSVGVANGVEGSGKDLPVAVEVKAGEQLEVLDGTTREVKVSEGREGSVTFRIRAKKSLGSANLTFFASGKDKKSKQSVDLSVRPPVPYLTTVSTGSLKDRKVEIPVARRMYKEYRKNDVAASVLPLGLSRGLMMYLDDYPYGCTEQIVSRAFPSMLLRSRRDFGVNAAAADQSFGTALKILQTRQNDRGAFGFWAANSYVSDFQVAYAAHFLTEAKERGQPVPPEVLARALVYLRSLAARPFSSDWEARDRAYALYVLARNGGATGALITQLRDQVEQSMKDRWKSDLTAAYLAGAYKLVKQDKLAEKAFSGVKIGGTTADYVHFYDGLLHDAGVLYIASRHFPERLDSLSGPAIAGIAAPITSGWYNTLSSSYAILALDAYLTALGNRASASALPFTLSQLIDKQPQPLKLPDGLFPHLTFSEQASKLILESSTDTPAFFQVTQAGFDLDPPSSEIKEQLEVQRELQTLEGKVVKEVPLGSEVEVHLKLRSVQGGGTAHVAIVDLLPGGFEVVMDRPRPARAEDESSEEEHAEESEGGEGEGEYAGEGEGEGEGTEESASSDESPEDSGPEYTGNASEAGYGYVPPIGAEKSSFSPEYVDVREDRVVLYGRVDSSVSEFVYRIKATNQGQFTMPPAFAEGMYDRRVRARSVSGSVKVDKP